MIHDVMDIQDVADQLGVKPSSVKYYWKHDRMPPADILFNGTPGWYRDTINTWRPKKAVFPVVSNEYEDEGGEHNFYQAELWDEEHTGVVLNYGDDESRGVSDALAMLESDELNITSV